MKPRQQPPYEKMMAYLDGEMSPKDRKAFEELLRQQPDWRDEFEEMVQITESTRHLHLRPPDPTVWDHYWEEIDNRLQKRFGWAFALVGALILILWGFVKVLLYAENNLVKVGIILVALGVVVLFAAAIRGRLLEVPRDRYGRIRR